MNCPQCDAECEIYYGTTQYCQECGTQIIKTWKITYVSCEGNQRWYNKDVPAHWEEWQVRQDIQIGGLGDDPAEIISVEPT